MLIWGVKREATDSQQHMISRATRLIDWLDEGENELVLTAQVVAEYHVGNPEDAPDTDRLRPYTVYAFDYKAALVAGRLRSRREYRERGDGYVRKCLKADMTIVATAVANGVGLIYTDDTGLRNAAERAGLQWAAVPTLDQMTPPPVPPAPRRRKPEDDYRQLDLRDDDLAPLEDDD